VIAVTWVFGLASVAFFPGLADRTRRHRTIGSCLLLVTALGITASGALSGTPVLAIAGLSLAAIGFVAMQPIFWTLPTEYMTGYAAAAGIGLINSLGNLGGFLAPNMRDYFVAHVGPNAGLYSLAVGAVVGAVLFALTGLFRKANEVEAGKIEGLNRVPVPH
jgi:MFS family permease